MRVKLIGFINLTKAYVASLFIKETKKFCNCFVKVSLRVVTFLIQRWGASIVFMKQEQVG